MFDFEDRSWLVSVLLLVVLWVMGVVMPVRMVAPRVSLGQHYLDADDSPEQDAPAPVKRPSVVLPSLVCLVSLGLVALSIMKRIWELETGARWTWLSAAAGLSALWALVLIMMSLRIR